MLPQDLTEDIIIQKLRQAYSDDVPLGEISTANSDTPDAALRCAAVLLPLTRFDQEWHLLFTRRTNRVETHKGQVSFPGGACDPGENTPEQTALREAQEEIGLRPQDVRVLGRLNSLATITSFRVSQVVGIVPWPYAFRVENAEVARVFTMPLAWLSAPGNCWEFNPPGNRFKLIVYHPYDGELLWGATASMTRQFIEVLLSN
jgi:8-oxo-dGTP pyrophosphatase MutT (NUDIX family)